MRSQALGLAERLGVPFEEKTIRLRQPWSWLPGHLCPAALTGLDPSRDLLTPPWPDLLISCGRRSTAASIAIHSASEGTTRTVHIQNPLTPVHHFDLVVSMRHDHLAGENVVNVDTALHRVTREKLDEAAAQWGPRLRGSENSLIGVVLGGPTRHYWMSEAFLTRLKAIIRGVHEATGARIVVTPSRRTEERVKQALAGEFHPEPWYWQWDGSGDNPYFGLLALADRLIVTADSVSMVSEAVASGHPVNLLPLNGRSRRHDEFASNLDARGLVSLTGPDGVDLEFQGAGAVDATAYAAEVVRERLLS
ncbi:mitochondrial fission ELM1 family protein [Afifella sp. YEN Y35]|uniref:mitochondrial fission ELM1 family protein n=1 Tax=Afifella sp. YEN Y35 TaxID=3388337 RepID=UPI0039E117A9